ncbi:MAG: hypothetical protein AAGK97_12680 [Bacteroidota bacterium]
MLGLEKLADWWDSQKLDSDRILQEWVNSSSNDIELYSSALIATTVTTAMELGGGLVDLLRLGKGVKEGGWGYGRDALRLLTLAGPAMRLGRLGLAKWTYNPSGPLCATVTTTKVARHTGHNFFMSAATIFKKFKNKIPNDLKQFKVLLKSIGISSKLLQLKNIAELKKALSQNPKHVIMFAVKWTNTQGKQVAHALYGFRNSLGKFKIADRTGKVVSSLKELEPLYPNISNATMHGSSLLIRNAIIIEGTTAVSQLAFEVNIYLVKSESYHRAVISPILKN